MKQLARKKAERLKEKYDYVVGIDPDTEKSGVALYEVGEDVTLEKMSFAEIVDAMTAWGQRGRVMVQVEKGWSSKTFYHLSQGDKKEVAAKKGYEVGRNHQTGILIVEMGRSLGVDVKEINPLRKTWKGADRKITHEEFVDEMRKYGIGYDGRRENQDERDAALIATAAVRI